MENQTILTKKNIKLNLKASDKYEAIKMAGNLLVESGYVEPEYIDAMVKREDDLTTYIGKGIAIPHGIGVSKDKIKKSGMVVLQFPEGVAFDDEIAYLIIGIAGIGNEHLSILSTIATAMDDDNEDKIEVLKNTKDAELIYKTFTEE